MDWLSPLPVIVERPNGVKIIPTGFKLGRPLRKGEIREELAKHDITKETSQLLHAKRRELTRIAAIEGHRLSAIKHYEKIRKGVVPEYISDIDAWELANEKLADAFYESNSAKSISDVFSTMGRAAGIFDEKGEKSSGGEVTVPGIEGAKVLYQIINIYESGKHPEVQDIIDAESVDAETN